MIRRNRGVGVALPHDALDLPDHLETSSIRDWTDYGIWGLLLYDEQPPWFTLIECMHILFYKEEINKENLFEPVPSSSHSEPKHEATTYRVPLNLGLRYLLFRDLETPRVAAHGTPDAQTQWQILAERTERSAFDLGLSFNHLQEVFEDVKSLNDALDLLRSTEVEVFSKKRWTSRHVLPLGPDMLFADVREGTFKADRRFVRRSGEMLYLMLGRARFELRSEVEVLLRQRLLAQDTPWNQLARLIRGAGRAGDSRSEPTVELSTGYLPIPWLPVYDRLAEDWKTLLALSGKPIEDLLDPLMRLSALHEIIYILDRAQTTKTGSGPDEFPPFVFELAGSARKNPVQRISLGQYGNHLMLPRQAIDAFIDLFAESDHWKAAIGTSMERGHANNTLKEMFLWEKEERGSARRKDLPDDTLDRFRASALKGSKRSIWATFSNQTKGAGMAVVKRGAGTWYAPNDALLEALVLANVTEPTELGLFLGCLYDRYRIVVGQEQAQRAFGPNAAISLEQLKINEQRLEHRLRVLGFVDRKSDACAFVVNPYYEGESEVKVEAAVVAGEHESVGTGAKGKALQLAARVTARRISKVVSNENGSRVMYAIVDLGAALTSAIGKALAERSPEGARIEVAIHPELAVDGFDEALKTREVATRFRNRKDEDVAATIFSVPARQMEGVLQSLGTVERINEAWLCDPAKADVWATETLLGYLEEIRNPFEDILRGLMESGILTSAHMLANFCAEVHEGMSGSKGLDLGSSVSYALPELRLPRDCAPEMKAKKLAENAAVQFRRWRNEFHPHLYLEAKDGLLRPRQELIARLDELVESGSLEANAARALRGLVNDLGLTAGVWRESQQKVAELPWADVQAFFRERARRRTNPLGRETISYLDDEFPNELSKQDRDILEEVRRETHDASPEQEAVFLRHRERLSGNGQLYKRWERFLFNKPVDEGDDLLRGLIRLAERACHKAEDVDDPVLLVRLRGAKRMSFWSSDKNTDLCTYLRDRYRGLDKSLSPWAVLDFGRCWEEDWEGRLESKNEKGGANAEFEFEAFVVNKSTLGGASSDESLWRGGNKAQMIWKPGSTTFATALAEDLRRVLPEDRDRAFLLRSRVASARSARSGSSERATIENVASITDSLGGSQGALANPAEHESEGDWNRIDELFRQKIDEHASAGLSTGEIEKLLEAFEEFHFQYTEAIRALTAQDGAGVASGALIDQAKSYGALLHQLRRTARADILVRDVWATMLQIGTASVTGDADAMIVTLWHPLRLAELAAKTEQTAQIIQRIVRSPSEKAREVEHYVKDRIQALQQTYYANIGVVHTDSGARLLIETETRSGYSLLGRPRWEDKTTLADEPIHHVVEKFGEIADQYLKQRPHERANFSSVLLDAEADELPSLVARHLAGRIEDEGDLRCDLSVTHEDPQKLRQIYERQNRQIGHDIESSLTSEAGRNFLSRLRVGITSPVSPATANGTKRQDIVLLHDVIARQADVTWHEAPPGRPTDKLLYHVPTDISRRKSQSSGGLSASVYLTSPWQVEPSQAYLDAMHDVLEGRAFSANAHFLPAQQVELGSRSIARKLAEAHKTANWVITYDRIADRRLIARSAEQPRILRYFSAPRSFHNVIVSTEVSRDQLLDRLHEDIDRILPRRDNETLERLVATIEKRSTSLSGGIVMRGAHWDNYAQELIGLIVAQREIELLLSDAEEHRCAMFFLDEFKDWFDLSGEIADILAVDLCGSADTGPRVRIVIVEAKCVGEGSVSENSKRSWTQLANTYTAIANRFAVNGTTMDPALWRHRLADMLVEHMDPWGERETIAGRAFDQWLDSIRHGEVLFEVSGHSIVSVRDKGASVEDIEPKIDEPRDSSQRRRPLAQWRLGADQIAKTIRGLSAVDQLSQLYEPSEWPKAASASGREGPRPNTREQHVGTGVTPERERRETNRGDQRQGGLGVQIEDTRIAQATVGALSPARSKPRSPLPTPYADGAADARTHDTPKGWKAGVHDTVVGIRPPNERREGEEWLKQVVERFKQALQAEDMQAPVENAVLTPNSALLYVDGRKLTVKWLEGKRTDLMTGYGVEILRITPMAGRIAVALKRPRRGLLHLSEVWSRRKLEESSPTKNMALVVGEQEDDGSLFYLSLESDFEGKEQAAPHTLVSGTTGSGKGILVSNFILDVCAFNDPQSVQIYLIDPKRGADYLWAHGLPHLHEGIVEDKGTAITLLRRLVVEMEERYSQITQAGCANISQYNRNRDAKEQLPRVIIFFDEVANWMQDDEFKKEVESIINEIATKSRAAGLHLIMIYQRADKDVMTMQLRTNLGNKLILRLGDEGSSRIALGEKGAEDLQGKGHVIAKLGTNDKIYGQVPFIEQEEARSIANAIMEAWTPKPR